ncbi:MAG: hypothetical protein RJA70_4864 [Pseudomonadota bacterium]|jgi:hypothetical protein
MMAGCSFAGAVGHHNRSGTESRFPHQVTIAILLDYVKVLLPLTTSPFGNTEGGA